jgi:hypothetical protein
VWRRFIASTLLFGIAFGASPVVALANISRSFSAADATIVSGSLVSTTATSSDAVTLADTTNSQQLVGVAVPIDQSLLAIDASSTKVQVAVSGAANVLVSTLGGDINNGDQVAVSPIRGVGMVAGAGMRTIGIAQGAFSSKTEGATVREITDKSGHSKKIYIGLIPVAIVIGYASPPAGTASGFLGQVDTFASAIAGHNVSTSQSILSFLIALVAIIALVALIYGAIHGSLISIGRNPLSRVSIYRSLAQIVVMALLIAITAIIIIYLILL